MRKSRLGVSLILVVVSVLSVRSPAWSGEYGIRFWEFVLEPGVRAIDAGGSARFKHGTQVVEVDLEEIADGTELEKRLRFLALSEEWILELEIGRLVMDGTMKAPRGEVAIEQILLEGSIARELSEFFDATLGLRYWTIDVDVEPADPSNPTVDRDKTWMDFHVGLNWKPYVGEDWTLLLRTDFGGLGSSDLGWNAEILLRYVPGEWVTVAFGYRVVDVDFEESSDQNQLRYDANLPGPTLALGVRF